MAVSQYFFISSADGWFFGRTTRNPTKGALVCHQSLFGICGSLLFHFCSDCPLEVQHNLSFVSFQEPPRTTLGYRSVGVFQGFSFGDVVY